MNGFLYSLTLQWKLDIRSKSLLVTYYIVPLISFSSWVVFLLPLYLIWVAHSYSQ